LDTLEGKTICGLFGAAFHFEETFPVIAALLKTKYPTATFVGPDVITGNKPIPEGWDATDPQLVANYVKKYKCDAVIVGNGC
jgi:hypothetical protein